MWPSSPRLGEVKQRNEKSVLAIADLPTAKALVLAEDRSSEIMRWLGASSLVRQLVDQFDRSVRPAPSQELKLFVFKRVGRPMVSISVSAVWRTSKLTRGTSA